MSTARGQITIVDLNDAKTVNLFLSANHPTTQIFNQDGQTFVPNWDGGNSGTDLVIMPELLISGVSSPKFAAAPTWKINGTTVTNGSAISGLKKKGSSGTVDGTASITANATGTNNYQLTIRGNMADLDYLEVECEGNYRDTDINALIPIKATITFTKSVNTGQLCMARIDATGHVFKDEAAGPTPANITLNATLVRGSEDDTTTADATPYSVTWYKRVSTAEDTDGTADGWLKLDSGKYYFTDGTSATADNTSKTKMYYVNGRTLTVYPDGVDGEDTFKAIAKDTYASSASYNKSFPATFTIVDLSDPYSLKITSSNGETFKNGNISTTLTAIVQQGGIDVDTTKKNITYAWTKYNANGNADTSFNPGNVRSVNITGSDVSSRATFMCTATID